MHPCNLYRIAKSKGMSDEEIKADVILLMAGTAEIELQKYFAETNPMLALHHSNVEFVVPNDNPQSNVDSYQIRVDRLVQLV